MAKRSKAAIAIIRAVAVCLAGVVWMAEGNRRGQTKLIYSQFLEQVRTRQVASVIVMGGNSGATQATGSLKDGKTVRTVLPSDYRDAVAAMQDSGVNIEIRDSSSGLLRIIINVTPFLVLLGVWIFLMRKFPNSPRGNIFG
jgi:cell division protease FtsH